MAITTFDFTGTNGGAWPSPFTQISGTATIQTNRGRLAKQSTAWNNGRARYGTSDTSHPLANFDLSGIFYPQSYASTTYFFLMFRSTTTDTQYRLVMELFGGSAVIERYSNGVNQGALTGTTTSHTYTAGSGKRFRLRAEGSTLGYKLWDDGSSEPSAVTNGTDATLTSGILYFDFNNGVAATNYVELDDLSLVDELTPPAAPTGLTAVKSAA